jgi:hypothetical protein
MRFGDTAHSTAENIQVHMIHAIHTAAQARVSAVNTHERSNESSNLGVEA